MFRKSITIGLLSGGFALLMLPFVLGATPTPGPGPGPDPRPSGATVVIGKAIFVDGTPVGGASVVAQKEFSTLPPVRTITGKNGGFEFRQLAPGTYNVTVTARSGMSGVGRFIVYQNRTTKVNVIVSERKEM